MPHVSVIIPLFNKQDYICQTIESVRAQTYTDWELLVVDNFSTDNGLARVRETVDDRIRILSCAAKGVSATRNVGLESARGKWLLFLDADDLLGPDCLTHQLQAAEQISSANLVICCYQELLDGNTIPGVVKQPVFGRFSLESMQDHAIAYCPGPQHIFLVDRDLLGSDIRWSERLDKLLGEDTHFWFQTLVRAKIAFNSRSEVIYRLCKSQGRFNELSDPAQLFTGITAAIDSNLDFLHSEGIPLRPSMADTLMRFYYGVFLAACATRDQEVATSALSYAQRWLQTYFRLGGKWTGPMWLRRLLGLQLHATIFHRKHMNRHE